MSDLKKLKLDFLLHLKPNMLLSGPWLKKILIPDDVTIQVLTQAREHILKKTFDSLDGIKKCNYRHLYAHIPGTADACSPTVQGRSPADGLRCRLDAERTD